MGDESRSSGKSAGKVGYKNPPVETRFAPGNPGRKEGSRNKLGEAFVQDLYAHWQANGLDAIKRVHNERPQDYLKVIASVIPKEVMLTVEDYDRLSDDELAAEFHAIASRLAARNVAGGGNGKAGGKAQLPH